MWRWGCVRPSHFGIRGTLQHLYLNCGRGSPAWWFPDHKLEVIAIAPCDKTPSATAFSNYKGLVRHGLKLQLELWYFFIRRAFPVQRFFSTNSSTFGMAPSSARRSSACWVTFRLSPVPVSVAVSFSTWSAWTFCLFVFLSFCLSLSNKHNCTSSLALYLNCSLARCKTCSDVPYLQNCITVDSVTLLVHP